MREGVLKIGDKVTIDTPWADRFDYPNCTGKVLDLRHGGNVAIVETPMGVSPRTLHTSYLR